MTTRNLLILACCLLLAGFAEAQPGRGRYGGRSGDSGERESSGQGDSGRRDYGRRDNGNREGRREENRTATPTPSTSGSANPGQKSSEAPSTVPGFGIGEKETPKAPGFNVPLEVPGGNLEDRYDRRVIERAEKETLPRFDKNKDGFVSLEEGKDAQWDPPFADSDLDKDGRLSRFELFERYAKKMNLPPKTGVVYTASSGSSAKPAEGGKQAEDLARLRDYAKGLLNRYDDNKSGVLEKDEWKEMKPEYHAADTNKDNVITLDELAAKLAGFGQSNGSSTPSTTPAASTPANATASNQPPQKRQWWAKESGKTGDKEKGDKQPKPYRTLTATERLPKGLPDWFARNDLDADGQIMLSEYLTSPSETLVAEFVKYDTNGDGIITAAECLAVEKANSEKSKKK
jgi:Ca2+-binding EF-hand superfamily protein